MASETTERSNMLVDLLEYVVRQAVEMQVDDVARDAVNADMNVDGIMESMIGSWVRDLENATTAEARAKARRAIESFQHVFRLMENVGKSGGEMVSVALEERVRYEQNPFGAQLDVILGIKPGVQHPYHAHIGFGDGYPYSPAPVSTEPLSDTSYISVSRDPEGNELRHIVTNRPAPRYERVAPAPGAAPEPTESES